MKKIYIIITILLLASFIKGGNGASIYAQTKKIDIMPVGFNSSKDDFSHALTQNSRFVYFTSARNSHQKKAFVVERTSTGWTTPAELNKELNDGNEVGAVTLTPDGQYMIFAAYDHSKGGLGRTDLFSAEKKYGVWQNIQNLGPNVNSPYWDSQPTLSSDGNTLFFASDRPGGYGETDIYMCTRTREGWTQATNLGPVINSAYDDMSPVIASDNKTLTFASNRPGGLGGFDIYVAKFRLNSFTQPKNAGEPINSASDEFFYVVKPNSDIAYFSSDRPGGEGALDIYMAVPNPYASDAVVLVQGLVKDKTNDSLLGSNITVTDLRSGKKVADLRSDDVSGAYYAVLQPGQTYSITATKPGYVFYSERYEVPPGEKGHEENKDIYLTPLAGGTTRLLIYFDFDQSVLKDESIPELERTIEFLRENPNVKISLEGHTDDQGADDYNDKLSKQRADAAKTYLVNAGIEESRIKTMGYGKRRPLVKGTSDEARATNRRVELKIIS